jgi:hypothetical protein
MKANAAVASRRRIATLPNLIIWSLGYLVIVVESGQWLN